MMPACGFRFAYESGDECVLVCRCGYEARTQAWESAGWFLDDHLLDYQTAQKLQEEK